MPKKRQPEPWTVVVKPCGTPAEARAVARRVRRLVAAWVAQPDPNHTAAPAEER